MKIIIVEFVNAVIILFLCIVFRMGIVGYRKKFKKQLSYYKLLLNWNLRDAKNERLGAYILECGYKNVMIYGAGDLGKILFQKIKANVKVCAFIEKNPKVERIENIPILSCNNAKIEMNEIDCIIVTPIFDFESIRRELSNQNKKVLIIPLDELIRSF